MSKKKVFVREVVKLLTKNNLISLEESFQLQESFSHRAKESFDDFLLSEGIIAKDDLLKVLSQHYDVPSFDCRGYFFKKDLLHVFPKDFLIRNVVVPVERDENILIMVANDPSDQELLAKIGEHVSYDIQFRVGIYQGILDSIREYYDSAPGE
ncbi:hypothetical protein HN446_00640 [bacterium]|jgi:type IV pilus assembly protein PilB|nr:hypothetical protein [bacterium]